VSSVTTQALCIALVVDHPTSSMAYLQQFGVGFLPLVESCWEEEQAVQIGSQHRLAQCRLLIGCLGTRQASRCMRL
jgi:hypothetical protein